MNVYLYNSQLNLFFFLKYPHFLRYFPNGMFNETCTVIYFLFVCSILLKYNRFIRLY